MNTLDWPKLHQFVADRKPVSVSAGLLQDWFWTAATVYENGKWVEDNRAYLMSTWATAGFKAEMPNGDCVEVECNCEASQEVRDEYKAAGEKARADLLAITNAIK